MTDQKSSPRAEVQGYRPTVPRGTGARPLTEYSQVLGRVREAGLLRRRQGFYLLLTAVLAGLLAALIVLIVALGDSWYQLLAAAGVGIVLTQFGFLAHEASHREVFESGRANDAFGRVIGDLVVGISYSWWKSGHNRHHANPNALGKDPSVAPGVFVYTAEHASRARGAHAWYTRRQGYLFFPILLLAGLNLHIQSLRAVFGSAHLDRRGTEALLLLTRLVLYPAALALVMTPGKELAFLAVQVAVFGVAMACAFVPNHVGMPVLPADARPDFFERQVRTSRNIAERSWFTTFWMGGLNYQIEHHLFPNMPRPALRAASALTRQFCDERGITYTETGLWQAYRVIVTHMNEVGAGAIADPFQCPTARSLGR